MPQRSDRIQAAVNSLSQNERMQALFHTAMAGGLPDRAAILSIVDDLRRVTFPGMFETEKNPYQSLAGFTETLLASLYARLRTQIAIAMRHSGPLCPVDDIETCADQIARQLIDAVPHVQRQLFRDAAAGFAGDPAARSEEEIIFSYPGFYAIFVYRYAHILHEIGVPFIPRIMTEHAHSQTGIDIHPGAVIGEDFFIDHGTGIVIGETTVIGNGVKIYQGVTLGALSTRAGQQLAGKKRHPTIEDNVVIYANTTVLGGDTVVGSNSVIAGNTFITASIPPNSKVASTMPDLQLRNQQPPRPQ